MSPDLKLQVKCKRCGHIGLTSGIYATRCDWCDASVEIDGTPLTDVNGKVVETSQFGGIN